MKVYFNDSCKICKAEIDLYKKEEIEEIDWVDITDNELAEQETSKDSKQLLRRLHVKDGEKVIGGAEAFLLLWKKMPKYRFLYNFLKLPVIFNLFAFVYEVVAFFLYLKNNFDYSKFKFLIWIIEIIAIISIIILQSRLGLLSIIFIYFSIFHF